MKSLDELMQIAAAGGGLDLRGTDLATHELMQIAAAASHRDARIYVSGNRPTDECIQIAAAGRGCVIFWFD